VRQNEIELRLAQYHDPRLGTDLVSAKVVKRVDIDFDEISVDITVGYPNQGVSDEMAKSISEWLSPVLGDKVLKLRLSSRIEPHGGKHDVPGLPNVKNIIAVASGKGGVGKSTVAVNLALALSAEGAKVGLLDADIYGPSQPTMLATQGRRPVIENKCFMPIESHGLKTMSIGYLVDGGAPLVWRGPMIGKAMQQMLYETNWGNLDYLIIDLPPGTGDIQITLCQKIPVSGAVIVTTPQDLALSDVRRACEMFAKLNVPILGVVENMSSYHCPKCGHDEKIFGEGGAEKLAQEYGLGVFGSIPLDIHIREQTDSGIPPVAHDAEGHLANLFRDIARKAAGKLSLQTKDYSSLFPKVVVEQDKDMEQDT
jgi:ATP-binding protein involved in chromosome partitioning